MFGQSSTMEDWVWCPCQYSSYGHLFKDVCWFFSGDGESGCGAEDEHPFPALISALLLDSTPPAEVDTNYTLLHCHADKLSGFLTPVNVLVFVIQTCFVLLL